MCKRMRDILGAHYLLRIIAFLLNFMEVYPLWDYHCGMRCFTCYISVPLRGTLERSGQFKEIEDGKISSLM